MIRPAADSTALLRLLQLVSPQLPVGAYPFSQGLEWAVHAGWVSCTEDFSHWLQEQLDGPMLHQELPLLSRLFDAFLVGDYHAATRWSQFALACRETAEFREEERDRALSMYRVLEALLEEDLTPLKSTLLLSPLAGIALAASRWRIAGQQLLEAHAFAWLENQVAAGIKLIPLGQSAGQQLLYAQAAQIPEIVRRAEAIDDDAVGYSCVSITQAGCLHETQYSRLYRS